MSIPPSLRTPAPLVEDRDQAINLVPFEPNADGTLHALLDGRTGPASGHAAVLGARLGGLARAFARAHPSWLVTAVDPSVALLSASLDALRPAGLSCQLTVMQSSLPALPLEPQSTHRILGDLPLVHLADERALEAWAQAVAEALHPNGSLHLRLARPEVPETELAAHLASVSPPWAMLLRQAWAGAFAEASVLRALTAAGLRASTRRTAHLPHDPALYLDAVR